MGVLRSFSRPLLLVALMLLIAANADVADASFLSGLKGSLKGVADKIKGLMSNISTQTSKKFSVLSKFFGDGKAREDLTLPEIFNNVFSRNNGIVVGTSNDDDREGQLGDGSSIIAAISTGGAISVTSNNGLISITTGTSSSLNNNNNNNNNENADSDSDSDNDNESNSDENNNTQEESENGGHVEESEGDDGEAGSEGNEGNDQFVGDSENPEPRTEEEMTFSGSDLDDAFIELLSDWERLITSSIWDIQDNPGPEATIAPTERLDSLVPSARVVNGVFLGNRIASGAPFAVKFFYNNEENFYCSGSLIGYPYALTAAHCGVVEGDEVRVGGRLLRSGYKATVAEIFTHPDFKPSSLVHDIAVIRLDGLESKKELIKNGVKAARINRNDSFPYEGFTGILSGHGSVETDGQGVSDELQSTRQSIYKLQRCRNEITQGDVGDEESYLCAGDGERSTTCVGDSGGGLWRFRVKKTKNGKTRRFFEIFGVVSFGEVADDALCPRGPPTVFQKVSLSSKWIQKVVGKKNMP